jgi:hypothetical protein
MEYGTIDHHDHVLLCHCHCHCRVVVVLVLVLVLVLGVAGCWLLVAGTGGFCGYLSVEVPRLDGQTDCVKTNRIRLSAVNPSAVRWHGTALDGQTDCVKTNRIRLSVVNPSAVRWLGTTLDGQTDCVKTNRIRLSAVNPSAVRYLDYLSFLSLESTSISISIIVACMHHDGRCG